jgi:hypothetical protein
MSDADLLELVQAGYRSDPWFELSNNLKDLQQKNGLWYRGNQLVVPNMPDIKRTILYELHSAPYSGHPGVEKTKANVSRLFWWPGWAADVLQYVSHCPSCQRNKAPSTKPAGLLQPLSVPGGTWEHISMDFITHLPKSPEGFDALFVVVDRLSKMVHAIPTHDTATAEDTALLFYQHVFKLHGLPVDIVSDRDPKFTSHFWKDLAKLTGTKLSMSTAAHPQSDGQTERVNRVLQDMLRHYVGSEHRDWNTYLPAVTLPSTTVSMHPLGCHLSRWYMERIPACLSLSRLTLAVTL